jgi:hypothetical protein
MRTFSRAVSVIALAALSLSYLFLAQLGLSVDHSPTPEAVGLSMAVAFNGVALLLCLCTLLKWSSATSVGALSVIGTGQVLLVAVFLGWVELDASLNLFVVLAAAASAVCGCGLLVKRALRDGFSDC